MSVGIGQAKIDLLPNQIKVTGCLMFNSVSSIHQAGLTYLEQYTFPELEIELSQIEKSDSSGLAVLLNWIKTAKQKNIKLHFTHVPPYLLNLAKVCGIEKMLPIS